MSALRLGEHGTRGELVKREHQAEQASRCAGVTAEERRAVLSCLPGSGCQDHDFRGVTAVSGAWAWTAEQLGGDGELGASPPDSSQLREPVYL